MQDILRWFVLLCGIGFSGIIIRLLLKHKISTRNSVAWLFSAVVILVFAAYPAWLDQLAHALGVHYPPTLMFLFSTMVLLLIVLYQSMQISVINEKLRQLSQHVALHDLDNEELARQVHSVMFKPSGTQSSKAVQQSPPAPVQDWLQ